MPVDELFGAFSTLKSGKAAVPPKYTGFLKWLGVTLEPGQRALALVAYDGLEPEDLDGQERELAKRIFGGVDRFPETARSVVVAACGARSGKTYLLVSLRMLHGALTRDLKSLAPGEFADAMVIAPNHVLRRQAIRYSWGAVTHHTHLADMVPDPGKDVSASFTIKRPDGRKVSMFGGVATRGGYGGRGRSLTDAALDEAAFFRGDDATVNDVDIFKAVTARVLPGGQTIVASTTWAERGLLYDLYKRNFGKPEDAMVAHAPTRLLRTSKTILSIVDREEKRDPDNARQEYGAEFLSGGSTIFFEPALIEASTVDATIEPQPGDQWVAGADFGFRTDSSALVLALIREGRMHVVEVLELRPRAGQPLKPGETVKKFAEAIKGRCEYVMCDQHYRESIDEHLAEHKLSFAPAPSVPADAFVKTRTMMRDGGVTFPRHERLLRQMREVEGRPQAGGGLTIHMPRWRTGGHGDLVSALVLCAYQTKGLEIAKPPVQEGTPEWETQLFEARRKAHEEQKSAKFWDRPGRDGYWRER